MRFHQMMQKDIVNITDGAKIGNLVDVIFALPDFTIESLIINQKVAHKWYHIFFPPYNEIIIPFKNIVGIGVDVILVNLN